MDTEPEVVTTPRMEQIKVAKDIFKANECAYKEQYQTAESMYSTILDSTSHPAAFMNRALCHIALGHPHLAVNDSIRAYMAAQHILSDYSPNDETVRLYQQISNYANECHKEIERGVPWTSASAEMLQPSHKDFELARMTVISQSGPPKDVNAPGDTEDLLESPVEDLRLKAMFRLTYALAKCGRGPAYTALCILEGIFRASRVLQSKHALDPFDHKQLLAVARMIEDNIMEDAVRATLSEPDYALTLSRFSIIDAKMYGFIEHSVDEAVVETAIERVDSNAIVKFTSDPTLGKPTLVADQDAFRGSVLFTECLPFVVSTANTCDPKELDRKCDTCGAELRIPTSFSQLIRSEEERLEKVTRDAERGVSTISDDISDISVDEYLSLSPESDTPDDSECIVATPPRGHQRSRANTILETSDIQVCRTGNSNVRENFTYCTDECHDIAMSTYHDSICGTHIENYLRTAMISAEHPKVPSTKFQKLTLLILVRILSWCHATSTDPLDLPAIQLLLASPRYGSLRELPRVTLSFHNNVLRPLQMLQAMDGRTSAPSSAIDGNFTDGRILNTIISLIERHLYTSTEIRWEKLYSEDGYLEETIIPRRDSHNDNDIMFGRLHPLCDLVLVASTPEDANVELLDLGDGRVICVPFSSDAKEDVCVKKGTALRLRSAEPRRATTEERTTYARKYDGYGAEDVIMDEYDEEEEDEDEEMEEGFSTSEVKQSSGSGLEALSAGEYAYRSRYAAEDVQHQEQEQYDGEYGVEEDRAGDDDDDEYEDEGEMVIY